MLLPGYPQDETANRSSSPSPVVADPTALGTACSAAPGDSRVVRQTGVSEPSEFLIG